MQVGAPQAELQVPELLVPDPDWYAKADAAEPLSSEVLLLAILVVCKTKLNEDLASFISALFEEATLDIGANPRLLTARRA